MEGAGSIPGQGAKIPHALRPKNQNISSIVTNSIKTLKMVHIKKKKVLKIKPHVQTHTFTLANLKFSWKISFYETRQDLMFYNLIFTSSPIQTTYPDFSHLYTLIIFLNLSVLMELHKVSIRMLESGIQSVVGWDGRDRTLFFKLKDLVLLLTHLTLSK